MNNRIALSFKQNERDLNLLKIINKQGSKSNFIKDAIEFYIKYKNINFKEEQFFSNEIEIKKEEKKDLKTALGFMNLDDLDDD